MSSRQNLAGQVLADRYELTSLIRPGRYGDLWRARRLKDEATVAVRTLKPELFQDDQAIVRFEREARVLGKFHHPNLLLVLDQGRTERGSPFMVFEHKEGRLLSEEIPKGELDADKVCHIVMQIAAVLAAAHSHGIVHRGLEPDAILLCTHSGDPYHVKLFDFGAVHLTSDSGEAAVTRAGQRIGKPEYLSPEYIEENALDARSDVYGLGIITFEMLTGQPPFVGPARSVLTKHLEAEPWPPSEMSEYDIPEWLDRIVLDMLAKSPDDRPASGLAVARAFTFRKWPL